MLEFSVGVIITTILDADFRPFAVIADILTVYVDNRFTSGQSYQSQVLYDFSSETAMPFELKR